MARVKILRRRWRNNLAAAATTAAVLLLVLLNTDRLATFYDVLKYRIGEFEMSISVSKEDCYLILWTRSNRNVFQTIKNLTAEALLQTNFNRYIDVAQNVFVALVNVYLFLGARPQRFSFTVSRTRVPPCGRGTCGTSEMLSFEHCS